MSRFSTSSDLPIMGFVGFSGAGKTTLLEKLIRLLTARGIRVAAVKHTHHRFDMDKPGKDSYRLRKAGAGQVLVASRYRWALIVEQEQAGDPDLEMLIRHFDRERLDLILFEGFKHAPYPKIEVHRPVLGHPLLQPDDDTIVAVATDARPLPVSCPVLNIHTPEAVADFVLRHFGLKTT